MWFNACEKFVEFFLKKIVFISSFIFNTCDIAYLHWLNVWFGFFFWRRLDWEAKFLLPAAIIEYVFFLWLRWPDLVFEAIWLFNQAGKKKKARERGKNVLIEDLLLIKSEFFFTHWLSSQNGKILYKHEMKSLQWI